MSTLYSLTDTYRQLLEVAESNDSEAVKDTLDSLSDAIEDKAENTAKVIRDLESQSKAKKDEAQRLRENATSLDNQVRNLKNYLQEQLTLANKTKIKGNLFTVSVQNNPVAVYVTDEKSVPKKYFTPQAPTLNKKLLKAELKNGLEIEGAELKQEKGLRIR